MKDTNFLYYLKKTYKYADKEKKYLFYYLILCILMCVIDVLSPLVAAQKIISSFTVKLINNLVFVKLILNI